MQELRAKLSLNLKDWKKSLEEARRDMATGFKGGPAGPGTALTGQLGAFRNIIRASGELRREYNELGGAQSRLAKLVTPFQQAGAGLRGLRQMFQPGEAGRIASDQKRTAMAALGGDLLSAERQVTAAQARVTQRINALRKSTGISEKGFDFWKVDPRLAPQIRVMESAQNAVAKLRDQFQSLSKSTTPGVGRLNQFFGGALTAVVGLGSALGSVVGVVGKVGLAFVHVFSGIASIIMSVAKTIVNVLGVALRTIIDLASTALKSVLAVGATGAAVLGFAMKQAANIETQRVAIGLLIKDVKLGNAIIDELQRRTLKTPFDIGELTQAARYLTAVGFAGKEIPGVMEAIADAAAGTGKGSLALQEISLALGQIKSKGRLAAEEMTRQLANAGVNAWKYLADASGKSVREIQEHMKNGIITAEQALPVIIAGMQKQFGGAAARLALTTEGTWKRVLSVIKLLGVQLGEPINRVVTPWLDRLVNRLDVAQGLARRIGEYIATGLRAVKFKFDTEGLAGVMELVKLGLKAALAEAMAYGKALWSDYGKPLKDVVLSSFAVVKEALIYGFEAAAPTLGKILGGIVGASIGALAVARSFMQEKELTYSIGRDQKALEEQQEVDRKRGYTSVAGALVEKTLSDQISRDVASVNKLRAERKTKIGEYIIKGENVGEAFARENFPHENPVALKASLADTKGKLGALLNANTPALGVRDESAATREEASQKILAIETEIAKLRAVRPAEEKQIAAAEQRRAEVLANKTGMNWTPEQQQEEISVAIAKIQPVILGKQAREIKARDLETQLPPLRQQGATGLTPETTAFKAAVTAAAAAERAKEKPPEEAKVTDKKLPRFDLPEDETRTSRRGPNVDRFMRVGQYIAGGGTVHAVDFARQTALNTAQMVRLMGRFIGSKPLGNSGAITNFGALGNQGHSF